MPRSRELTAVRCALRWALSNMMRSLLARNRAKSPKEFRDRSEHPQPRPTHEVTVEGLVRAIDRKRVPPTQPIALYENDATQDLAIPRRAPSGSAAAAAPPAPPSSRADRPCRHGFVGPEPSPGAGVCSLMPFWAAWLQAIPRQFAALKSGPAQGSATMPVYRAGRSISLTRPHRPVDASPRLGLDPIKATRATSGLSRHSGPVVPRTIRSRGRWGFFRYGRRASDGRSISVSSTAGAAATARCPMRAGTARSRP